MKGLESSFLSDWSGWDECDTFSLQFYNAVYRTDVGIPEDVILAAGDSSCFTVDGDNSKIYIYDSNGEEIFNKSVKLIIND